MQGNKIDITCILLNKNRNTHVWFIFSWHVEVNVTLKNFHLLFIYLFIFFADNWSSLLQERSLHSREKLIPCNMGRFFFYCCSSLILYSQPGKFKYNYPLFCYIVMLGHSWGRKISSHECNVLSQCKGCNHLLWFVKPSGSLSYTNFYCNTYTK